MTNFYRSLALMGSIILALITPLTGFYSQCVAPTPTANNATITCGQTATLTASGGTNYSWYSNAAGTQLVGTGSTFTTPMLGSNTTYYVQNSTGNNTNIFYITSLATTNAYFFETNTYTGDDRGGMAVTQQYCYLTGDQFTARYDMPNLTNSVSYTRRDGIFSDMAGAGTLYTLWNSSSNSDPVGTCTSFQVNAVRTLNADCSLGNTVIPTSQSVTMGSCNDAAVFNGVGFVIIFTGSGGSPANTYFKIDLPSGTVTSLGSYGLTATFTENWARWGVAEYNGNDYSVVYAGNNTSINRLNLTTGVVSTVQSFTNLSDMASLTYSPWDSRWYCHWEGGAQWGGSDESIAYLSGTHSSQNANACYSSLVPVTVTVNSNINPPTASGATINCGQTATLTATGGNGVTYTWYSNQAATAVIGSGATFTTPSLGTTTTYYVASTSGQGAGTTYTFSNASSTGPTGPTQAQINTAYANTNLANSVTINTQGIQEWIVPATGTYQIQANGAQGGGNGGLGARMQGEFSLTQGQKLFIVVGQQGNGPADNNACGGGGGSFVSTGNATYTTSTPLIVAGGGGGQSPQVGNPGLTTTNGGQGENCQPGGTNGNGGADASSCGSGAGGAGGFLTDGASGGSWGYQRGYGFISGAAVGGQSGSGSREGGFGCGAGTHQNNTGGGAGGGYSGGSASYHGSNYEGGGGGSYNNGSNQVNTQGINSGNGSVIISSMTPMCASSVVPVTVTVNSVGLPTSSNATIACGQSTTLSASGNGTIYWYSNSQGTALVGTGNTFTTPALTTTTTYYASLASGVCGAQNTPVTVNVTLPAAPTAANTSITCGQTANLTATNGGGTSYAWFSNAAGTNQVGTGANFTTPVLNTNTTYYVAATNGNTNVTRTFTNCGATGNTGPTQVQVNNAYAGTSLANLVTINTQGIQEWTVPATGTYTITASGAKGGDANAGIGGDGATITISTTLTQGDIIKVLVGQQGGTLTFATGYVGGGGGGTYVYNQTTGQLILVAGGGGGAADGNASWPYTVNGGAASAYNNTSGGNGIMSAGSWCSNGNGGAGGAGGTGGGGTGGAGWNSAGTVGSYGGGAGQPFSAGGQGGTNTMWSGASTTSIDGGFGGGGGAGGHTNYEANAGGGGGYSGGGGGGCRVGAGGGGGCFYTGTYVSSGTNSGQGSVVITNSGVACTSNLTPVQVTVNPAGLPTVNNTTITCGQTATLTASGNGTIYWYSDSQGTTQVGTGNTFTTPQLSSTTTYYVSLASGLCAVQNVPVTVTVNLPAAPTANGATITCGQTATLTANGGGLNNYVWYSNAAGTNQVGTGASFTTPALSNTTTYYVAAGVVSNAQPVSFTYTGSVQTYTVPANVTSITVDASGAGGGKYPGGVGQAGAGGRIIATIPVTPGQTLNIVVGGAGGNSQYNRSGSGGGGFTGVLDATNNHLVSAGGGGGAAGDEGCPQVGNGGNGGSTAGSNGSCGVGGLGGSNGAGPAGGAGGTGTVPGVAGNANGGGIGGATQGDMGTGGGGGGYGTGAAASQYGSCGGNSGAGGFGGGGSGGTGGCGGTQERLSGGGGGGGGYTGGGGGTSTPGCASCGAGGGGGGSNFAIATASNITTTIGGGAAALANGTLTITPINATCQSSLVPVLVTVNSNITAPTVAAASISCGQTATLTAAGGSGTGYTWYSDPAGANTVANGANFTTPALGITTTYYVASTTGAAPGSTYTFTNAGATGPNGPTQAQIATAYTGTNLANNVTINTQGIQEWVVPQAGTYQIQVNGAQGGGNGGLGARMQGEFTLTQGQKLFIVVGQQGNGPADNNACGGGGGSFVTTGNATYTTSTPLIVAGGGGGQSPQVGNPGLTTTSGGMGENCQPGGVNGNGGADASNCGSGAGGAGGFLTDGQSAGSWGYQRGYGFISGAAVGGQSGSGSREGGFGCGAGTHQNNTGGGAGGGYSGGSASYHGSNYEGGGGGSYNNGANQVNTQGINAGNGSVVITPMTPSCTSTLTPVIVTVAPLSLPTASGQTVNCGQTATLSATGNGTLYWYSNSAGTTQVGTGNSFTTPVLSTTTTYYVSTATGVCAAQNTPVTVTVNGLTAPTVSGNLNFCGNGSAVTTLTASGSPSGYAWWSNANGTGSLGNTASYTTPAITTTTTYYVQSTTPQGGSQVFNYSGAAQTFTAPVSGTYTLEAWGAQGGNDPVYPNTVFGGRGGYSKGDVYLTAGTTIYVYVGGQGSGCLNSTWKSTGGGGSTDFRLSGGNWNDNAGLYSRILVAGGGGGRHGSNYENLTYVGNDGGGLSSPTISACGYNVTGANQTSGGSSNYGAGVAVGSFGFANANTMSNLCSVGGWNGGAAGADQWANGGAGGGWYGGCTSWCTSTGGSGYVYTATSYVPAGYTPAATYQMANEVLIAGNLSMPDINGNTMTGNSGNGVAKISWAGIGCTSNVVPVTVTVGQSPVVSGGNNQAVCSGASVVLNGSGANTYTWNNNVQDGVAFNPVLTQTYTVTGTAANGCTDTATVTVTVNPNPDVNAGPDQTICAGESVVLTGAGANSYTWDNNVQDGVPFTPAATQTYTLTGSNANGCSASDQVLITVNPTPTVSLGPDTIVCENNFPYTINASGTPGGTYTWDNGATGSSISVAAPGTFTVTITDNNGCSSTDDIVVDIDPCAGLNEEGMSLVLYPNPFSSEVQIVSSESLDASIEVYASDGRLVYTTSMIGQHANMNLSALARGNYMVKIINQGKTHITKLVKQ